MSASPNTRVARRLAAVVAVMLGASFAAVPLYDLFCRVTGYGGTPTTATAAPEGPARAETVVVRFDANVAPGLPAEFRPTHRTMELRVGENALAFYEFVNLTGEPIAGTASFNVTPYAAAPYFAKLACFCFQLQELGPGERVEMPVSFFVDPAILEDGEAKGVRQITLSYTMHSSEVPPAAEAAGGDDATRLASTAAKEDPEAIEN